MANDLIGSYNWSDKRLVATFKLDGEWRIDWIFDDVFEETKDRLDAIDNMDFTETSLPKDGDGTVCVQCKNGHLLFRYAEPSNSTLAFVEDWPYKLSDVTISKLKTRLKALLS